MTLEPASCSTCGASTADIVDGKPRAALVLLTVELSGRPRGAAGPTEPTTTVQLCPRCYRAAGYATNNKENQHG